MNEQIKQVRRRHSRDVLIPMNRKALQNLGEQSLILSKLKLQLSL